MNKLKTDILIVGGGVGGCAAALAIAEAGHRAILTEETAWIGGQFTSQAVPPDENGWIEHFGCTATYRRFREGVRQYYRDHYPLRPESRDHRWLNPGNGWVSPLCHEPRVALAVFEAMLAPHVSSGRIQILVNHRPVAVDLRDSNRIANVTVENSADGSRRVIAAEYFLDATENGDLLPLSGTEFVTGSESRSQTGEPSAPEKADPKNSQSFSICFILEHLEGESHVIARPERYDYWRNYVPKLSPSWPGRLLSWEGVNPRTMERFQYRFDPHNEEPTAFSGLWSFRRIIDRDQFLPGAYASDLCLVNWPMIDYMEGDLLTATDAEREERIRDAKQQSLSMVYWMQTEAPRPDGGTGWPGLRLRGDLLGTDDGLAMAPYIRESRRIQAVYTIVEQDVAESCRPNKTLGVVYDDSVGIGHYRIDLHPSAGGDNYIDVASQPFTISLGALIPKRMENLLPAAKNIGTTHITNGCYRLHPVEWNIGEAAGSLAAWCLKGGVTPRQVQSEKGRLRDFQKTLTERGVELHWPKDLNVKKGDPHIHALKDE